MLRRTIARCLVFVMAFSGLFAVLTPSAAALGEQDYKAAVSLLSRYGLVQGDDRGFRFHDEINRAEMAKLLVYSLGMESQVPQYTANSFRDTRGHWAEGIIGLARSLGVMKGYPEGDFRPWAPVTYAEVITVLLRLTGRGLR